MKRELVEINVSDYPVHPEGIGLLVWGYPVPGADHLYLNRMLTQNYFPRFRGWSITHRPTGKAIVSNRTWKEANRIAKLLATDPRAKSLRNVRKFDAQAIGMVMTEAGIGSEVWK